MGKELSAPLLRTARLLDLVPYLHANQGISIKELSVEFGVTQTQIQSDLTTLWMCGLPGYTPLELIDLEFESGYVTIRNASTLAKPRKISFDEGLALLLGLQLLTERIPSDRLDLREDIDVLSERLSHNLGVPKTLRISSEIDPEISQQLIYALKSSSDVEISYHSLYSDKVSTRRISPQIMYEEDERSYVQAHCHLSNSLRIFRIDRILSCIALDKIDLGGHALDKTNLIERTSSQKNENNQIPYEIRVISATRDIAERFGIQSVLKEQGNQVGQLVQLQSFSEEWVERAVLATGADIELTRPAEIRREVYNRAKSLFNRYTSK